MKHLLLAPLLLILLSSCSSKNATNWETYEISYEILSGCRRRYTYQIDTNSYVNSNDGITYDLRMITEEQYPCKVRENSKLYKNETYTWSGIVGVAPSKSKGLTNCPNETHWFESERVGPFSTSDWRKIRGKWWSFQDNKKTWRLDKSSSGFNIRAENLLQKVCVSNKQSFNKKEG